MALVMSTAMMMMMMMTTVDAGFDDAGDDVDEDDGENGGSDCQDFSDIERENDHEPLVSSLTLLGRKCNSRAFFLRRAVG